MVIMKRGRTSSSSDSRPPPSSSSLSSSSSSLDSQQQQQQQQQQQRSSLSSSRSSLPIASYRESIIDKLRTSDVLVLVGETGSGKSTQVPQFLLEVDGAFDDDKQTTSSSSSSKKKKNNKSSSASPSPARPRPLPDLLITCTQPRRVAALTVGSRVALEAGCPFGGKVGVRVRFDERFTKGVTKLLYQTDGMLLREAAAQNPNKHVGGGEGGGGGGGGGVGKQRDGTSPSSSSSSSSSSAPTTSGSLLSRYSVIILDEAHERSLRTDVLFGVVRLALEARRRRRRRPRTTTTSTSTATTTRDDEDDSDEDEDEVDDGSQLAALRREAKRLALPPLKVVVMSATMDVKTFVDFFQEPIEANGGGRTQQPTTTTTAQTQTQTLVLNKKGGNTTTTSSSGGSSSSHSPTVSTLTVPGRQYPVQVLYLDGQAVSDYVDACATAVLQIHEAYRGEDDDDDDDDDDGGGGGDGGGDDEKKKKKKSDKGWGDILVFLPGQEEIEDLATMLRKRLSSVSSFERLVVPGSSAAVSSTTSNSVISLKGLGPNVVVSDIGSVHDCAQICVLYAALPPSSQLIAFSPRVPFASRKIIISTNVAETSVTLENVKFVVDSGKHKTRSFNARTGMEALTVEDVSKAQANQRAGRSGRTAPGVCVRLYTEKAYESMQDCAVPEILRVNLGQVVLQLKSMGVVDPRRFAFVTPPHRDSLIKAFELLYALGALDATMSLTKHGANMAKLPLDPVFAHMLLLSPKYGCVKEMLSTVAMLSAENVFYRPAGSAVGGDDDKSTTMSTSTTTTTTAAAAQRDDSLASKAAAAHRRFASWEGDLPTLLNVYNAWSNEAVYVENGDKNSKEARQLLKSTNKMPHGEWCAKNFIDGRAMIRAREVRAQLADICGRDARAGGLGFDTHMSFGQDKHGIISFLKNCCAGLFLHAATRNVVVSVDAGKGSGKFGGGGKKGDDGLSLQGRYKTKFGSFDVSVHPTSTLFQRNPAPQCVVYTELLVTKKSYIRGVTQVKEEWLSEVAPVAFPPPPQEESKKGVEKPRK